MKRAPTSRVFLLVLWTAVLAITCAVIVSTLPFSAFHDVGLLEDDSDDSFLAHSICASAPVRKLESLYPSGATNSQNSLNCLSNSASTPILFLLI
jgi:hypothetical protein